MYCNILFVTPHPQAKLHLLHSYINFRFHNYSVSCRSFRRQTSITGWSRFSSPFPKAGPSIHSFIFFSTAEQSAGGSIQSATDHRHSCSSRLLSQVYIFVPFLAKISLFFFSLSHLSFALKPFSSWARCVCYLIYVFFFIYTNLKIQSLTYSRYSLQVDRSMYKCTWCSLLMQ